MPTHELYPPLQKKPRRAARIEAPREAAPLGRRPVARVEPALPDRMRHPLSTSISVARPAAHRLVVNAEPNWSFTALAVIFFVGAYVVAGSALINGQLLPRAVDHFMVMVMVIVLLHVAFRYLLGPLGADQTYVFDKAEGLLSVTTRGMWRDRVDHYPLGQLVKLHVNRVDDGIYDPSTMLVIFQGGGTLQFPLNPAAPARIDEVCDQLSRFLGVPRSDQPLPATPPAGVGRPRARRAPAPPSVDALSLEELAAEASLDAAGLASSQAGATAGPPGSA